MTTISIIDDHNPILNSLSLQFQTQNYSTITFNCPEKALTYHAKNPVEGYVIDMKMPKMSGIDFYEQLCLKLKKESLPALFLTAVDNLEEKALKETTIGDYVLKPFKFNILLTRLEKIMANFGLEEKNRSYKVGNLEVLQDQIMVKWFGKEIELTKSEFNLLNQLTKRPRVVYTRDQLLDICYGEDVVMVDRNIDSHIKRLRKKFRKTNPKIKFDRIKTHYGNGYSWTPKFQG